MQCTCATTDLQCNEIFSFVNASRRNISQIFIKFGTRIAKIIFKANFVCDRKRKSVARMRGSRISIFLRHFQYFTSKNSTFFIQSSPYLGTIPNGVLFQRNRKYEGRSINKFPTAPFHQFLK